MTTSDERPSPKDELGSLERPTRTRPTLHAITLHRPWAWAIAHSTKRVENRTWKPTIPMGSYIAIHAGKTWDEEGSTAVALRTRCMPEPEQQPTGIVAVARLARVIDCAREDVPEDQAPWTVGPFAWLLDDVVALETAVACAGKQGLWPVEGALLVSVRSAWAAAKKAGAK